MTEQSNPARLLEGFYQSKALMGFVITDVEQASDPLTRVTLIAHSPVGDRRKTDHREADYCGRDKKGATQLYGRTGGLRGGPSFNPHG